MKERIVTVLDGPLDGRRMVVTSDTFSGIEHPRMSLSSGPPQAPDQPIKFRETVYEVVELRRDVYVGVPRSWVADEYKHGYFNLLDRICAHLCRGYVGGTQ